MRGACPVERCPVVRANGQGVEPQLRRQSTLKARLGESSSLLSCVEDRVRRCAEVAKGHGAPLGLPYYISPPVDNSHATAVLF